MRLILLNNTRTRCESTFDIAAGKSIHRANQLSIFVPKVERSLMLAVVDRFPVWFMIVEISRRLNKNVPILIHFA
jgi:hypothetical protein